MIDYTTKEMLMWPYNEAELAFINSGAGRITKEKKMYTVDNVVEFYRNTANVVLAYVPNKEIKDLASKIVDVQVDLTKVSVNVVNNLFTNAQKSFASAK
jgi:hypothetical protein